MTEKTNPGIQLPPEERKDEPTGPIEGASAGAKHFKRAASIAAQTRDDVQGTLETPESGVVERSTPMPPQGTREVRRRPSTSFAAVRPSTTVSDSVVAQDIAGISENAQAAIEHAREAQGILDRGRRRADGEEVEPTLQFKIVKPEEADAALAGTAKPVPSQKRPSGAYSFVGNVPSAEDEEKDRDTGKSAFQKVIDILKGGKDGDK
ncbi:MAG: hypothetical protein A2V81_00465 [Candidatus Abawacabacteria bacterium RBG_16_42_10]|uniref:Uncharacterized protein n=1 Tax=Candidatus Abawacabacteria bacterium RBG_16_42_10 TaxID=1817814 RepID=A0A1F4XKG3_9BACT|nr:MAG: hypothetical protein A2V81_00465 [Candidatus Abawacabacteria bacterium RBG_16_42_10]